MTSISEILSRLEHHGARLERKPEGGVRVKAPAPLPEDLLEVIRANKADLIKHMTSEPAILEHLATVPESRNSPGPLEQAATNEQDASGIGPDLLPSQSPWLELSNNAQSIWEALEAQGTRTLHLIDQDGRKCCHSFTASKPSDLQELARRGLKTWPRVSRLTVIAVLTEVQIWQLEPRTIN